MERVKEVFGRLLALVLAISKMLEECGTNPILRVGLHREGNARWCFGRVLLGGVSS